MEVCLFLWPKQAATPPTSWECDACSASTELSAMILHTASYPKSQIEGNESSDSAAALLWCIFVRLRAWLFWGIQWGRHWWFKTVLLRNFWWWVHLPCWHSQALPQSSKEGTSGQIYGEAKGEARQCIQQDRLSLQFQIFWSWLHRERGLRAWGRFARYWWVRSTKQIYCILSELFPRFSSQGPKGYHCSHRGSLQWPISAHFFMSWTSRLIELWGLPSWSTPIDLPTIVRGQCLFPLYLLRLFFHWPWPWPIAICCHKNRQNLPLSNRSAIGSRPISTQADAHTFPSYRAAAYFYPNSFGRGCSNWSASWHARAPNKSAWNACQPSAHRQGRRSWELTEIGQFGQRQIQRGRAGGAGSHWRSSIYRTACRIRGKSWGWRSFWEIYRAGRSDGSIAWAPRRSSAGWGPWGPRAWTSDIWSCIWSRWPRTTPRTISRSFRWGNIARNPPASGTAWSRRRPPAPPPRIPASCRPRFGRVYRACPWAPFGRGASFPARLKLQLVPKREWAKYLTSSKYKLR